MTLLTACLAFVATNIDDLFMLMLVSVKATAGFRYYQIVVGYYAGILLLIALSLLGWIGAFIIPQQWIGWLGILPIWLGVKALREHDQKEERQTILSIKSRWSGIGLVAGITVANGGDNLGVYIPLFARSTPSQLLLTILVFLILTGNWGYLSYYFTHHPAVTDWVTRYGQPFAPFLLIGLGVWILLES